MSALLLQHRGAMRRSSRTLLWTLLGRNAHLSASKSASVNGVKNALSRWECLRKMLLLKSNRAVAVQPHGIIKVSEKTVAGLYDACVCRIGDYLTD